jgi:tRNA wybutosine-synthesizing protein 1
MKLPEWDSPEDIAHGCLEAQDKILTGYKGNLKTDLQLLKEAFTPRHVAISLTGEPTLYEPLGELIRTFHNKGLTTFLVSNGTMPQKLSQLSEEPTQLYISSCAPNEKIFKQVCRPQIAEAWVKLNETLALLTSFRCPTALRMTLTKRHNMEDIDGYAALVNKANPSYVEAKGYMHVGFSSLRLTYEIMPSHKEVFDFAAQLALKTGYKIIDESTASRVVLLSRLEKPKRLGPA